MPVNSWWTVFGGLAAGSFVGSFLPKAPQTKSTAPYELAAVTLALSYYYWPVVQSYGEFVGPMGVMLAAGAVAPFYIKMRG